MNEQTTPQKIRRLKNRTKRVHLEAFHCHRPACLPSAGRELGELGQSGAWNRMEEQAEWKKERHEAASRKARGNCWSVCTQAASFICIPKRLEDGLVDDIQWKNSQGKAQFGAG